MVCKLKFNYNIYRITTTNSNTNSRRHSTLPATFSNTSNLQVLKEIRDWYGVCDDSQPSLECTHYAGVSFIVCLYMRTAVQSKILIQLRQKPLYYQKVVLLLHNMSGCLIQIAEGNICFSKSCSRKKEKRIHNYISL